MYPPLMNSAQGGSAPGRRRFLVTCGGSIALAVGACRRAEPRADAVSPADEAAPPREGLVHPAIARLRAIRLPIESDSALAFRALPPRLPGGEGR